MLFRNTLRILLKLESAAYQGRNASNIAFIGLGNMGSRMANNLIKKGENLKVFDVVSSAANSIQGAKACKSPEEAVENSDIVITMLPNGGIVKDIVFGERGILKKLPKNTLLLDCSTVEPKVAQEIFEAAQKNGIRFLDAPVSGGIVGAEAGTLCFMVGGEENVVREVEPVLLKMGSKVLHCGKAGGGQIAKICNNLILGVTMIGTAEALSLGAKLGLDPKLLTSVVNISSGRSWSSDTYNPVPGVMENVPSSKDYNGGFAVKLIAKDLALAEDAAKNCSAAIPLAAASLQLYRTMMSHGKGDKDFSIIYKFLRGEI